MSLNTTDSVYTPVGSATTVNYTATAGSTSNFTEGDHVWVFVTTAAYVAVGPGVTATTGNGVPIPANVGVVIPTGLKHGSTYRVSAIQISAGGQLFMRPLTKHKVD